MSFSNFVKKVADRLRGPRPAKTRFIVLAKYRVGSTYLRSLLNRHDNIRVQGELFNVSELSIHKQRIDNPIAAIDAVFRHYDRDLTALGFKLMYNQLSQRDFDIANWPDSTSSRIANDIAQINRHIASKNLPADALLRQATEYLAREPGLKVIHLKRHNMLDTLLSTKRAFLEDNWLGNPYKNERTELTTEECLKFFEETTEQEAFYDNLFCNNDKLNVSYEDLVEQKHATLASIQEFLDVPPTSLGTDLAKQGSLQRNKSITNFDELKDHFQKTKWNYLF